MKCRTHARGMLGIKAQIFVGLLMICGVLFVTSGAASAGDGPPGFWYGADGYGPGPTSSLDMPVCGGMYATYAGRVDNIAPDDGFFNVSYAQAPSFNADLGEGIGMLAYIDVTGPRADPYYNGTAVEAETWGVEQAWYAFANWDYDIDYDVDYYPLYPIVFADMESGNPGWIAGDSSLNRDVFNGWWEALQEYDDPLDMALESGWFANPSFNSEYMSGQILTGTWGWESNWAYEVSGNLPVGDCVRKGFQAPDGFTPSPMFGTKAASSGCFFGWQWANSNGNDADWDTLDSNRLSDSCE